MKLSIVTTLYRSAPFIKEFYDRISKAAQAITSDYEIIFVNDGSPDHSVDLAVDLHKQDSKVKVVDMSKNFGHHKAIMTGLSHASGDRVFLIDCDLEEDPELLDTFSKEMDNNPKKDAIYGLQESRKGGLWERFSGSMFYTVFNAISENKIPRNFLTVRMMTQRYVQALTSFQERELNFSTLIHLTGFETKELYVKKGSRQDTSYTFFKRFAILVNAVTSSTSRPLWFVFYLGLFITIPTSLMILQMLVKKFILHDQLYGWTSLIISIWFFGGLTIFVLGLLGIYLSKIFAETKVRPYTIIRARYGFDREIDNAS